MYPVEQTPEIAKGTGKWRVPGVPHAGWIAMDVLDLEDSREVCEMCEVAEIRFVHVLEHQNYGVLRCGCVCAGWMQGDCEAAVDRERRARNRAVRRQNWLARKWRISASGNRFLNADGHNIVVFFNRGLGCWASCIKERETQRQYFSRRFYETWESASLGAFNALMFLLDRRDNRRNL